MDHEPAKTKKQQCAGPGCGDRRIHHESPDVPRGPQFCEVPDDFAGDAYCSLSCAIMGGEIGLNR